MSSEGVRTTVYDFARLVVGKALEHQAVVVLERNAGQGWLEEVFQQAMRDLAVHVGMKVVSATHAKRTRAEPVAALYERDRVRHLGRFAELEEQMASFTGQAGERSPDRLDSAVWALSTFSSMAFGPEPMPEPIPWDTKGSHPTVVAWS